MSDVAGTVTDTVLQTLQALRQLNQVSVQHTWQLQPLAQTAPEPRPETSSTPVVAEVNHKEHIAWEKGRSPIQFTQTITVPEHLQGYPVAGLKLYFALTWWADQAEVWVDGQLVQAGDLFDCSARILLTPAAQPGTVFQITLQLVSPGHDHGALVRSLLIFESPDDTAFLEPSFIADEWQGLYTYLQTFAPEQLPEVTQCLAKLTFPLVDESQTVEIAQRTVFQQHLNTLRQQLQPLAAPMRQRRMDMIGHAHLDLAWLWPIPDTWEAAERTFCSVLALQERFPELTFTHSSPALFEWLEINRPELFAAIQAKVAAGSFEIAAGLWVEPEMNLIDGESIVRQILYGQRYTEAKFGSISRIAWLPDTFGFCWQLPQLLRQGGIDYFVTQKLRWNDTTQFPYDAFWWQSPDGTQIFTLMSALIGQEINPIKMTDYAWEWEQKTHIPTSLWLPGVGDHGGGPTQDMLETARRWQNSPFFPQIQFSTVIDYLEQVRGGAQPNPPASLTLETPTKDFPVWANELYLEFHRGCYTTHADQKRFNRKGESLLYQAELFASLATAVTGCQYPQAALTTAWKGLLFNQFHDILPGSSIPEVYLEANQIWATVFTTAQQILDNSLATLSQQIQLPEPPVPGAVAIAIFNPLSSSRTEVIAIPNPDPGQAYQVLNTAGEPLPSQGSTLQATPETLFLAENLPSIGYQVYWLCPLSVPPAEPQFSTGFVLENQHLRVEIDPVTGDIAQIQAKNTDPQGADAAMRPILQAPGNQLQFFQDQGQYWDAWNIDPNYAQHPLPPAQLASITWLETGKLRQRLRVVRTFQSSRFQQDYVLDLDSPCLKIESTVDWQERHVLVKAAFPLAIEQPVATYEIPYAAIARPNDSQTPAEKAMWEVPALRWADVGNAEFGVSLLNDCKYGYDCQGSLLRLTLLRGSVWPNPDADRHQHQFTYALFPHSGSWQAAGGVHKGHALNQPPLVRPVAMGNAPSASIPLDLPPKTEIQLSMSEQFLKPLPENVILTAWKPAESNPQQWILRCYEAHGQSATIDLDSPLLNLASVQALNLLETPLPSVSAGSSEIPADPLTLGPWQVRTLGVLRQAPLQT